MMHIIPSCILTQAIDYLTLNKSNNPPSKIALTCIKNPESREKYDWHYLLVSIIYYLYPIAIKNPGVKT